MKRVFLFLFIIFSLQLSATISPDSTTIFMTSGITAHIPGDSLSFNLDAFPVYLIPDSLADSLNGFTQTVLTGWSTDGFNWQRDTMRHIDTSLMKLFTYETAIQLPLSGELEYYHSFCFSIDTLPDSLYPDTLFGTVIPEFLPSITISESPENEANTFPPANGYCVPVSLDNPEDAFNDPPISDLEIVGANAGFSEENIYLQLENVNGQFTAHNGSGWWPPPTQWYMYGVSLINIDTGMLGISFDTTGFNPDSSMFNPDSIWSLLGDLFSLESNIYTATALYTDFSIGGIPIISPGLYRFALGDSVLPIPTRIGDVAHSISGGILNMEVAIADLVNDSAFGNWPNASGCLAVVPMTFSVGLNGTIPEFSLHDLGTPGIYYPRSRKVTIGENDAPEILDWNFVISPDMLSFGTELIYRDGNTNLPESITCSFAGYEPFPLFLIDHLYSSGAEAVSYPVPVTEMLQPGTYPVVFTVSDGIDVVNFTGEYSFSGTPMLEINYESETVNLNWEFGEAATFYIYRSQTPDFTGAELILVTEDFNCQDSVNDGQHYFYRVIAEW